MLHRRNIAYIDRQKIRIYFIYVALNSSMDKYKQALIIYIIPKVLSKKNDYLDVGHSRLGINFYSFYIHFFEKQKFQRFL